MTHGGWGATTIDGGAVQRLFWVDRESLSIPAVIWLPENPAGPCPLVVECHHPVRRDLSLSRHT